MTWHPLVPGRFTTPVVAGTLAVVATALVALLVIGQGGPGVWTETEWLISYDGGFVRRGLAGSLVALIRSTWGVDPGVVVVVLSSGLFAAVAGLLVVRVLRAKGLDTLTVVILLFLPALSLFPAIDTDAFGRKETLFVLLLGLNVTLVERVLAGRDEDLLAGSRWYSTRGAVLLNLIAIPIALTHEAVLLLMIPVSVMVTARGLLGPTWSAHRRALLFWSPTMAVAGLGFIWHGSPTVSDSICRAWVARGVTDCLDRSTAIGAVGWSFEEWLNPGRLFEAVGEILVWILVIGLCTLLLAVATSRVVTHMSASRGRAGADQAVLGSIRVMGRYLIVPVLVASPLYVFAADLGRWFWIAAMGYALILTSPALLEREIVVAASSRRAPWNWRWIVGMGRAGMAFAWSPAAWAVTGFVCLAVRLPNCCLSWDVVGRGLVRTVVEVFG